MIRAVDEAALLVGRLLGLGVTEAVLAPGSRSGPLALALHAADTQGLLRLHVRVDEREAGFLALGLAKGSGRPVPVVTTSGTAVANLHPAMLEALHADVPVLAVTADRPARLRGTGANQTTDQRSIFPGLPFVHAVHDLGPGPMHLNLELDEPLVEPTEWLFAPADVPPTPTTHVASTRLSSGPRTVVVAGDDAGPEARRLAQFAGWPLLAEPTSGSRTGDALVAYRPLIDHFADRVERVVSFGHATLSRPVTRLLTRTDVEIIHVGDQSTFPVPAGANATFVESVEAEADDLAWLDEWRSADAAATAAIDQIDSATLAVARTINAAVPPDGLLVVGSSSPVRDLDLVARPYPAGEHRKVVGNRGLAGIDGMLSTAIGAALGRVSSRALALVGDLTFLHGTNGLLIGPEEPRPDLTIVVVNDDGGSIFATLEQGAPEFEASFERVYATPTGTDLAALCAAHGVPHRLVEPSGLAVVLADAPTGIEVVEVRVDRHDRRELTAQIQAAVGAVLAP